MPDPRLIVALDVPTAPEALSLAERIGDAACFYKIGLGMLTGGGLAAAIELKDAGHRVFLDLKLFDIPATIENGWYNWSVERRPTPTRSLRHRPPRRRTGRSRLRRGPPPAPSCCPW